MRSILFCLLLIIAKSALAQNSIAQKMEWLSKAKPNANLFVHFDKNVYSNNETVYFTGYLLKSTLISPEKHSVMAVSLIRDIDSAIIIQDKFIMEKGLSFGSIDLPDSIITGNYHFIVFTDKLINGLPEAFFTQAITIKTNINPAFKASMKIISDDKLANQKVLISTTNKDNSFLPKPSKITYRYGSIIKTANTDASGQLLINIAEQKNIKDLNLYVKLKNQKDSVFISMALPQQKNKAIVKFYPEGGNLVDGLVSQIGWEVKDQQQMPIALTALLYKNNVVVDTIETMSYGIGSFKLVPEKKASYTVKLIHSNLADSFYFLPKSLEKGLTINVKNAVVNDTLSIYLRNNDNKKINLLVHNFNEQFINSQLDLEGRIKLVKIPLTDLPKGLMTITLLDSLQRPLAERIFFAHHHQKDKLNIATDKNIYNQREKITLKVNLSDQKNNAFVSIATVQANRIEIKNTNDIESYTYLKNELSELPVNANATFYKDKNYLEQILLVKGWRRYTWQDLEKIQFEPEFKFDSLKVTGTLKKPKSAITKRAIIGTFGGVDVSLIPTNDIGEFNISINQQITENGKKMYLFVNNAKNLPYLPKIVINDSYLKISNQIAKLFQIERPVIPTSLLNNSDLVLESDEKAIRLKEVDINNNKDARFNYLRGANICGDYVCVYNILNCRNHIGDFGNKQPRQGNYYYNGINGRLAYYPGCNIPDQNTFFLVNAIHKEKEFYLNDYKDPQEPAFFSTIYWNYGTILSNKKETEIEFYTSDITGKFKVVVQGITNNDVVFGEHYFEVKPKQNP